MQTTTVKIKTRDGDIFNIECKHAYKSILIKNVCTSTVCSYPIHIQLSSKVFKTISGYMQVDTSHLSEKYNPLEIRFKQYDLDFFNIYSDEHLLDICNGANYLDYPCLLELCCKLIAERIKYKTVEELREFVGMGRGMSPDEACEIEKEFGWMSSEE
ncbi:SCF ubiquitin ligase Skp1-like protein [Ordospora colligata]|uniref:E3 ubiquitin ligase complex SCF subunit n=1 Tax=Ordospora colligata OC4 TaxID=1354746 RepID=A0A0B2UMG3_9MICR|nr:SCF ubiquitin ligase Skp1-like protein [Ordospora colligata OC4]KHN70155.1 SCF ubiquitin ligase Skp1-like protein [Ordospora colligata OC4]TBU16537.1 SCF ubiquitin ligase Skp1-like protein [Ordospora colligata]TBU16578.1 SCF ubiquitin ligase Skp1-like protein [Ordospora colligata]TBU19151.1 SCF ubiquitin ligase Skp1-like protein [Ordospora colligata]